MEKDINTVTVRKATQDLFWGLFSCYNTCIETKRL